MITLQVEDQEDQFLSEPHFLWTKKLIEVLYPPLTRENY